MLSLTHAKLQSNQDSSDCDAKLVIKKTININLYKKIIMKRMTFL